LPFKIRDWTDAMLESQRHLSEVSAGMAVVFAQKDVFDLLREMRVGNRTAESAKFAEEKYEQLQNHLENIDVALQKIENYVVGGLAGATAWIIKNSASLDAIFPGLSGLFIAIDKLSNWLDKSEDPGENIYDLLKRNSEELREDKKRDDAAARLKAVKDGKAAADDAVRRAMFKAMQQGRGF
jgi:hypothetical protein